MATNPGGETFSASDLAPPDWEVRARRLAIADRTATFVAVLALGTWVGGLVALGACAAPMVFGLTPYPFSADAMGAAFARFDAIAIGSAIVALGAEVIRSLIDVRSGAPTGWPARARRYLGMLAAILAIVSGTRMTPEILRLHRAGVRRGVGDAGARLEAVHRQTEALAKGIVVVAIATMALHVATLRSSREEESADVPAPLPPGRRA